MKGSGSEAGTKTCVSGSRCWTPKNLLIRIRNTAYVNVWCYLGADPPTGRHTAAALLRTDYSRLHPARNHMRL
jgi:hypothetical protein